jgi:hypothetical protein
MADFIECLGEVHNENIILFTIIQVLSHVVDELYKLVYMKLNLATEIAPILTIFFQISLESDVAPSDWKTAHVAPQGY